MNENARLVDLIGYSVAMGAISVFVARQDFITNNIAWAAYVFYGLAGAFALTILSGLVLIGVNVAYRREKENK